MSGEATVPRIMEPPLSRSLHSAAGTPVSRRSMGATGSQHYSSRMQYRSRPVSVAVDPVSLIISECIAITSAIQKYARSPLSSVSAILGGNPSQVQLGPPSPALRQSRPRSSGAEGGAGVGDFGPSTRWGLRGKKGKSLADNPLISGFGRLRHELTGIKGT